MALRLDGQHYGELYDYWGGLADLKSKVVKVLHSLSFVDDPTRILRAVRYEQRYDFKLDGRTEELMLEAKELLKRVSGDRIRHEFDRIQEEDRTADMMERLHDLTILKAIHPDLVWDDELSKLVENLPYKEPPPEWEVEDELGSLTLPRSLFYTVWLMQSPESSPITTRLRLVGELADIVQKAAGLYHHLPEMGGKSPSQVTSQLDQIPNLAIYAVYLQARDSSLKGILSRYLSSLQHIQTRTTGKDLQQAGLAPGPRYSEILTRLRNAWLDGEIKSETAEKDLLEKLLDESEMDGDLR
jgi:tRNA nucleotidyltransferase (CCA-adding enzyme)